MPLAPPVTKIIVHEKSTVQGTWSPHGVNGWYIGPAPLHYWCYKVYITATYVKQIADMVEFFPTTAKMSTLSSADAATHAALDLIEAIKNPHP
eukprot:8351264-Ditylum_brightwellii.AAC.1